jgi:hypothetical protein
VANLEPRDRSKSAISDMANPLTALEAELGGSPPASLAQLDDDQLLDLAQAIRDARRRQAVELKAGREQSLAHIPKLLRGPVRRVVG